MAGRVLIVDDDQEMCDVLMAELPTKGYSGCARTSAQEAFQLLETEEFDVVVTDINMGGMQRHRPVREDRRQPARHAGRGDHRLRQPEAAIAAIRAGAYDFVTKPFDIDDPGAGARPRRPAPDACAHEVQTAAPGGGRRTRRSAEMLGESAAMQPVLAAASSAWPTSDASVLITGESGTGKELVARALHEREPAPGRPRSSPSTAPRMPEALLESELFGHVRGAFTDARAPRAGLFVQAHGGTLVPRRDRRACRSPLQAKLLRALQERRVRPVGGDDGDAVRRPARHRDQPRSRAGRRGEALPRGPVLPDQRRPRSSCRRCAREATTCCCWRSTSSRRSPTQTGKADPGPVARRRREAAGLRWPGNVRELQNCMERAVALTRYEEVTVEDLPEKIRNYRRSHRCCSTGDDPAELLPLEEMERRYVLRVMEAVGGNRRQAARILDLDRKTLYRRLDRYGYKDADA